MTLQELEQMIGKKVYSNKMFKDGVARNGEIVEVTIDEPGEYYFSVSFSPEPFCVEFSYKEIGKTVFLGAKEEVKDVN